MSLGVGVKARLEQFGREIKVFKVQWTKQTNLMMIIGDICCDSITNNNNNKQMLWTVDNHVAVVVVDGG